MRKVIILLFFLRAATADAQNNGTAGGKIDVFSSVGLGYVDGDYKPASGNSIQTSTGLEVKLGAPSRLGLMLSFDSYGFQRSGPTYNFDGSLKATALALFYRYKFSTHGWTPYLKAGGGTAWLAVPTVRVEQGITNIRKEVENVGLALAEAGLQVHFLSRYSLMFGAEKKWLAESGFLDKTAIGTTTFKIGLISSF